MKPSPEELAQSVAQLAIENDALKSAIVALASTLTPEQQQAARRRMTSIHVAQEVVAERQGMPGVPEAQRRVMENLYQALQRAQQKWPNGEPE